MNENKKRYDLEERTLKFSEKPANPSGNKYWSKLLRSEWCEFKKGFQE